MALLRITNSDKLSSVTKICPTPVAGERITSDSPAFHSHRFMWSEDPLLCACFRLRHTYFVEQRGWIAASQEEPGLERDGYDPSALHLAVSDASEIAAYMRLLPFSPHLAPIWASCWTANYRAYCVKLTVSLCHAKTL